METNSKSIKVGSTIERKKRWIEVLQDAQGGYSTIYGKYWVVIEYDTFDSKKMNDFMNTVRVKRAKVIHVTEDSSTLFEFFKDVEFDDRSAFQWAVHIGDREHMRKFIKTPEWAFFWATQFPEQRDLMRDKIVNSEYAYKWVRDFGIEHDLMRQKVNESEWAYRWAVDIGDKEIMKQFVTDERWAFEWAQIFQDRDMKDRIKSSKYAYMWMLNIGDEKEMMPLVTDPLWEGQAQTIIKARGIST